MRKNIILVLVWLICAASSSCAYANEIVLKIYPTNQLWSKVSMNHKLVSYIKATLEGFKQDQFSLRDTYCFDQIVKFNLDFAVRNGSINSLKNSGLIVNDGRIEVYPLDWHGKFCYLAPDDYLTIEMSNSKKNEFVKVEMPEKITKRLLRFFLYNTEDTWNCSHFLQALIEQIEQQDKFAIDGYYDYGWERIFSKSVDGWKFRQEEVDEDSLKPGDGIVLYSEDWIGRFNLGRIRIKHFTMALGNQLYISKHGNSGVLCVQDMSSMMKFWGATGFCRVKVLDIEDPENSELDDFVEKECGFFESYLVGVY